MTPPEVTWVVESGSPAWEAERITTALVVSAEKPWGVSIFVIRCPRVRMIRQPPR
jgi:hypothetical protein